MNDAVSRQEVIDEINNKILDIQMILENLSSVKSTGQDWILIDNEMPELKKVHLEGLGEEDYHCSPNVLIYCEEPSNLHRSNICIGFYEEGFGWADIEGVKIEHPVAWMPLPEPLKK